MTTDPAPAGLPQERPGRPSLRRRIDDAMEEWGYAAIGFAAILGVPLLFYAIYFSAHPSEDSFEARGRVVSARAADELGEKDSDGDRARLIFLELGLEGLSLPVRFNSPVFNPGKKNAPLKPPPPESLQGRLAVVRVAREDEAKLQSPPDNPFDRWVEGYALSVDGRELLALQTAIKVWKREGRFALYLANAFTFVIGGLSLFVGGLWLDGWLWRRLNGGRPGPPNAVPHPDAAAARRVSAFYYVLIPGFIALNVPAMYAMDDWAFDAAYWKFFSAAVAALQALFFLHHRRYLSIVDSRPFRRSDFKAGFFGYLAMSLTFAVMITPVIQLACRVWSRRG